jgi:site-specific recombinase XerD
MGVRYFLIYHEGIRAMAKISIDWTINKQITDFKPRLAEFHRYLETLGLKKNTVKLYTGLINIYLVELNSDMPSSKDAEQFYKSLYDKKLSRSAINNFVAAILKYHAMINNPVKLKFIRLNNALPYYFDQSDILNIFNICNNIKHYAMLKVLFFGCLRSGELCNLDLEDYDPDRSTLRLRETKNGSDAIIYVNDETVASLTRYLKIRPQLDTNALFITDYCNRWIPKEVLRMFLNYKEKAKITKKGGVHCFSRHSPATLMITKGCDLRSVQAILRHRDIHTTLRYTHLCDAVTREKQTQYLTL